MAEINENSDRAKHFTDDHIEDLVKSNEDWDKEEARRMEEQKEDEARKAFEKKTEMLPFKRLRKSPLEIASRSLFFVFLGSFLFSFVSVYFANKWWFFWYVISAFACILYTPNRKALKELLDAWPNIVDLIKNLKD